MTHCRGVGDLPVAGARALRRAGDAAGDREGVGARGSQRRRSRRTRATASTFRIAAARLAGRGDHARVRCERCARSVRGCARIPRSCAPDLNGARLLASGDALQLDAGRSRCVSFGRCGRCSAIPACRSTRRACALVPAPDARSEVAVDGLARGSARRRSVRPSARRPGRPSLARVAERGAGRLASASVERAAQAAGKPPVNSLWFWGGGVSAGPCDDVA